MDWDAIAAVGQAVSALTLLFVLLQVRQARESMERSAMRARLDNLRENWLAQAMHPQLAEVTEQFLAAQGFEPMPFIKFAASIGLAPSAACQIHAFNWATWVNFEASIESEELLSAGVREEMVHRLFLTYGHSAPAERWYEILKPHLNPDAVRYVDNLLAQQG